MNVVEAVKRQWSLTKEVERINIVTLCLVTG